MAREEYQVAVLQNGKPIRKSEFAIGDLLKDRVTGYQGIVMVIAYYSTGCLHYGLCPQTIVETSEGAFRDPAWIWYDESRLELVQPCKVLISLKQRETAGTSGPDAQVGPQ